MHLNQLNNAPMTSKLYLYDLYLSKCNTKLKNVRLLEPWESLQLLRGHQLQSVEKIKFRKG